MTRSEFLETLRTRLQGLPPAEIDDIVADYAEYFAAGESAGRNEADIARALGDPVRLARELRAEAGFKRWERQRSPGAFAAAVAGFVALIAMDFIILLPVLGFLLLFIAIAGLVAVVLFFVGIAMLVSILDLGGPDLMFNKLATGLFGVSFIAFGVGGGAFLIWLVDACVRLLMKFARLHYTLLERGDAAPSHS
ncbi:MAG: DUF1700 domain-containing protein [Rhodospirillaceae bacterium]